MRCAKAVVVTAALLVSVAGVQHPGHAHAAGACPTGAVRSVHVTSAAALRAALAAARPGDRIQLANGIYRGHFTLTRKGVKAHPIVVCGSSGAVVDGGSQATGYALRLASTTWVQVVGISIRHGQKGVIVDASTHVLLNRITVHDVGEEAVHFRRNTNHSAISNSRIYNTGRATKTYGEGVYVGSARSNWCANSGCQPDRSDSISISGNHIGPGVPAEEVDVKEGTSSGSITGNVFDGRNMTAAQSWVDIKGNKWTIDGNSGSHSASNGFTVTLATPGWGNNNVFAHNHATVGASGYGFKIARGVVGAVVYTNNIVIAATAGACNIPERG